MVVSNCDHVSAGNIMLKAIVLKQVAWVRKVLMFKRVCIINS